MKKNKKPTRNSREFFEGSHHLRGIGVPIAKPRDFVLARSQRGECNLNGGLIGFVRDRWWNLNHQLRLVVYPIINRILKGGVVIPLIFPNVLSKVFSNLF